MKRILPLGSGLLTAGMALGMAPTAQAAAPDNRPNILFILTDDLGWNDLGCMGSDYYETPNVDRLARSGVNFTSAYAACQVSSPSRASILTGKYTPRHGITDWIGQKYGEAWRSQGRHNKLLPAEYAMELSHDEYTLAECLRDNGYATFYAGKWHLGDEGSYPEDHGFETNIGGWSAGNPKGGYFSPYKNPRLADGEPGENLSMRLSRETEAFIARHCTEHPSQPFFAFLSFYAVHGPIETTQENWAYFREKAERQGIAEQGFVVDRTQPVRQHQDNPVYAGLVRQMDNAVGYILDALKRMGLEENTLVIFTSDNGGLTSGGQYPTSVLPLRGGKGRQWEGGIRVPLFIRYPGGGVEPGQCTTPVSGIDFYATLLDYAGIRECRQPVDGVSLRPLLAGGRIAPRDLFWHYPHNGIQGGEPSSIIRSGNWKLIYYHEDGHTELYDLEHDPGEQHALNEAHPHLAATLERRLHAWLKETGARMPVADPQYDAAKEAEVRHRWATELLDKQEEQRKSQLQPGWQPNADWWGSMQTRD